MKAVALAAASLSFAVATVSTVQAAEAPYIDDRSDPAALLNSLYSAISRKEYARAWDYFGDVKPAKDFATFVKGYEKTEQVVVMTGVATEEGAAGSIYYQIPVGIRATDKDGKETFFGGCYTARRINAAIQEPPFKPLFLDKGELKPAEGPLFQAMPEKCGDGPAPDAAVEMKARVLKAFANTYGDTCTTLAPDAEAGAAEPEIHDLPFRHAYQQPDEPEKHATLYRFECSWGAYNSNEVFYLADGEGGFKQLQFAEPDVDIEYETPEDDKTVKSITIKGYTTTDVLVNSEYDPATMTLSSRSKWRGLGDASSSGEYLFRNGAFTLVKYDIDPTYNDEVDPQTVIDFATAP